MPSLDRRAYLGVAAVLTASLAGCSRNDSDEPTDREPPPETQNPDSESERDPDSRGGEGMLAAGAPPRRLVSTSDRTLVVPDDYDTIQQAVSRIPLVMRHKWEIEVRRGTYDEHVAVPPFLGEWARPNQSELVPVRVTGDRETPSNVTVNSLFATSALGTIPLQLRGMQVRGSNPYDDERAGIGVYGCTEVGLIDVAFADGVNGVVSYNSQVMLRNVDFGTDALSQNAVVVKHGGIAYENNGVEEPTAGRVGGTAYVAKNGHVYFAGSHSTLSGQRRVSQDLGFVYDFDQQAWYGPRQLSYDEQRVRDASVEATAALVRVSTPEGSRLTTIRGGNRGAAVTLVADQPLRIVSGEGNLRLDGGRERQLRADDTVTFVHGGDRWLER